MKVIRHIAGFPQRLAQSDVFLLSESLAYTTLLSVVPFIAISLAVLHTMAGADVLSSAIQNSIFNFFQTTLGPDAYVVLRKVFKRLASSNLTLSSAFFLFFSSLKILMDADRAINRIWNMHGTRPLWKRLMGSVIFYITIPLGLAIYVGLRSAASILPLISFEPLWLDRGLIFIGLLMMNRLIPAKKIEWGYVLISSLISLTGLMFLDQTFSWLTKKAFNYSKLYGSLAALPLFCLWILLIWQILLFGVAVSASLRRRGSG